MPLRDASYPSSTPGESVSSGNTGSAGSSETRSWRVSVPLLVLKGIGVLLFLGGAAMSAGQPAGVAIMVVAAIALAVHALRDLLAPVRLSAGPDGLTVVKGFAGHEPLAWSQVQLIRVDERRRLGTISRLLEIDTGETLYLFGESELSVPVESVAAELLELKTRYRSAD